MLPWAGALGLLALSCVTGDEADEPFPAAPAPAAQEGRCPALLPGGGHAPGLIGTWCLWVTLASSQPSPAHSCENPPVGTAARMPRGTAVAPPPCLRGHPISGPASGAESPGGTPFWKGTRRASVTPQGPGAHPIPHILPRWGALTASPGRNGIPLEGRDACPSQRPDSPTTDHTISITAITGGSRACPGMPGEAGEAPAG